MKANFDFFIIEKIFYHGFNLTQRENIKFGADLIWHSEKKIKFGDFCHFAPNSLRAKIYPNKVLSILLKVLKHASLRLAIILKY